MSGKTIEHKEETKVANCTFCNKKLGTFENYYQKYEGDTGVCKECNKHIINDIVPQINEMINNHASEADIEKQIINKFANTELNKKFLINYLNKNWFKYVHEEKIKQQQEKEREQLLQRQAELISNSDYIKITTGYSFEGYQIIDYKNIVSGETVIGTGLLSEFLASSNDLLGMNSNSFSEKMRAVKENALQQLKIRAGLLDANAIIGVDFDYITFSNNMIGVSANGTAVVIEKLINE